MGARAEAMGNASACIEDVWSINNNIAGLAKTRVASTGFSFHAIPSASFFNRMAAVFAFPIKAGAAGAGVFRFGDALYNEHVLSLGFAHTFGLASLGAKLNYLQYHASGLGAYTAVTVSFGGIATLTPNLLFGAHIQNINQPVINPMTEEHAATKVYAGMSFLPSSRLTLAAELEKDLEHHATIKSGLDYQAFNKVSFRTGMNLHPESAFFGFGLKNVKLQADYSLQLNYTLGITHQATISYRFKRQLKKCSSS